jgi:acyl-CoA synthetase (NDP forming)
MASSQTDKTVLACFMTADAASIELGYAPGRQVPVYVFPEDAVQALSLAYPYSLYCSTPEGHIPSFSDINEEKARAFLRASGALSDEGCWLPPETARGLFREYGIPIARTEVAFDAGEAARVAKEMGFPVVMKLRSSTLTHKTDVGGVVLGLEDGEEVVKAFEDMKARMAAIGRASEMEGVVVQPMLKGGEEVIIGMSQDPLFGPLVMVGLGGIHVELIKDVSFSLHPLRDTDPDTMLKQLKSLPLLTGWRGSPPKDIDALREILLRFSALVEDFPEIDQIEINPLMVFDAGKGCAVVDARILCKTLEEKA